MSWIRHLWRNRPREKPTRITNRRWKWPTWPARNLSSATMVRNFGWHGQPSSFDFSNAKWFWYAHWVSGQELLKLYKFVMSTFPDKEVLAMRRFARGGTPSTTTLGMSLIVVAVVMVSSLNLYEIFLMDYMSEQENIAYIKAHEDNQCLVEMGFCCSQTSARVFRSVFSAQNLLASFIQR